MAMVKRVERATERPFTVSSATIKKLHVAPTRVLLIEDNPGDVELLSEAFSEAGIRVELLVAENAVQAFTMMRDLAADEVPRLVLIDINLPIIKGPTVLKEVREHQSWKRAHAVVLSSSTAKREIEECLRLGACEYIVKPARFDDYVALARRLGSYLDAGSRAAHDGPTSSFPLAT